MSTSLWASLACSLSLCMCIDIYTRTNLIFSRCSASSFEAISKVWFQRETSGFVIRRKLEWGTGSTLFAGLKGVFVCWLRRISWWVVHVCRWCVWWRDCYLFVPHVFYVVYFFNKFDGLRLKGLIEVLNPC